jgi:hypothetical protein
MHNPKAARSVDTRQPRHGVAPGDNLEKLWSPRVRLLFIVGTSLGLWFLIALITHFVVR